MKFLLVGLFALYSSVSFAHDHQRPDFDSWYQSLERPDMAGRMGFAGHYFSCCSKADCHQTEAEIRDGDWWARLVVVNGGIEERRDWIKIPTDKIIRNKTNPTGFPVICHTMSWRYPQSEHPNQIDIASVTLYCFIPSFES